MRAQDVVQQIFSEEHLIIYSAQSRFLLFINRACSGLEPYSTGQNHINIHLIAVIAFYSVSQVYENAPSLIRICTRLTVNELMEILMKCEAEMDLRYLENAEVSKVRSSEIDTKTLRFR